MNRSELIEHLAAKFPQYSAKDIDLSIRTIIDGLSNSLCHGGRVEIRGFGSFALNYRPPRKGRNPKTGEAVLVPAKYFPHFKPGKDLREGVDRDSN